MATRIIDADSHIVEPSNLWETYLEPEYRDRAMRIKLDEKGLEYLEINGKPSNVIKGGVLCNLMGAGRTDLERFLTPGAFPFDEARKSIPAAGEPQPRVQWLDDEGVDATILYPSVGLDWPQDCADAEVAAAYCRAYNNWLAEFCQESPHRLLGIGHITLLDVAEGVSEMKRALKLGMKGIYPPTVALNGIPYGEPHYDAFWAEAQDQGMPVSLHVTGYVNGFGGHLYRKSYDTPFWWYLVMDMGEVLSAFTSLFQGGVFERFPEAKVVVVETGSGWLPYWLERMDHLFDKLHFTTPLKLRPSEYFERQCWIVIDPDEKTAPATLGFVSHDRFLWGSDYPHTEGEAGALDELKENIASLSEETRNKILGANAVQLYNLN